MFNIGLAAIRQYPFLELKRIPASALEIPSFSRFLHLVRTRFHFQNTMRIRLRIHSDQCSGDFAQNCLLYGLFLKSRYNTEVGITASIRNSGYYQLYQIWYNSGYTKFGIIVASNAYGAPYAKTPHFCESGNEGFLLVEALPQSPQNTGSCSGNAGKFQRLRDFANR